MADSTYSGTYWNSRKIADDAELDAWMADAHRPPPPTPLGPPSPTPAQQQQQQQANAPQPRGAIVNIEKTIRDTANAGIANVVQGIMNRPKYVGDFEGAGQQLLGVLQILGSLPAGGGQALIEAAEKFRPGVEHEVAIKGGPAGQATLTGSIRTVLGMPALMMLNPETRKAIAQNPIAAAEELNKDMTYGEIFDLIGQALPWLKIAGVAGKGLRGGGGAKGEPLGPNQPAGPPSVESRALPPHEEAIVTPPPSASSAFETRLRAAKAQGPEAYARVVAEELYDVMRNTQRSPNIADVLRERYAQEGPKALPPGPETKALGMGELDQPQNRGPLMTPPPPESSSAATRLRAAEAEGPLGVAREMRRALEEAPNLTETLDRTLKESEAVVKESLGAAGQRTAARKARAAEEPPAPKAEAPPEGAAPTGEAEAPRAQAAGALKDLSPDEIDAVMGTLDMMHTELKEAAPGARHLVTDEYGKVEGGLRQPSTYPSFMDSMVTRRTRENADRLMKAIDDIHAGKTEGPLHDALIKYARENWENWAGRWGQMGSVDPSLLARMALGAAAGGTQGDTPEERIRNAFIGMGLGGAMSKKVATRLAQVYRESGLADESGAINFDKFRPTRARVTDAEQPYQPNYTRITATPEVTRLMKQIHRAVRDDILEARGETRSNELRVREAVDMIKSGKMTPERVLSLGDREMLTDSEYTAARMLHVKAAEHFEALEKRVLANDATVSDAEFFNALSVSGAMGRNVLVARERIAQAQQSGNIRVGGENIRYRPEDIANLATEIMPGTKAKDIATMLGNLTTREQFERIGTWTSLFPRMLLQGVYFSYLSGKAAARNVAGNLTMMGLAPVERGIGRFMPMWGDARPGILPGEATQMARALGESLIDNLRMVKNLDAIQEAARKTGVDAGVFKSERRQPAGEQFVQALTDNDNLAALGHYYDNVTTFPGQVLDRTDVMSKTVNGQIALATEAYRQATFEGLKGDAFEARVQQLRDQPALMSSEARRRSADFADKQTFTQEFQSSLLRAIARGPDNEWANLVYRSFIMPFFRVTARMTEAGMERLPGLNFLTKSFWNDWNAGGVQRQMAQARVVSGAAMLGTVIYLESQGVITGNAPKDPFKRQIWEKAGYPERSWWDPISGKWRSYDGLGPLTTVVAAGADTSMAARKLGTEQYGRLFGSYILSGLNSLDSRTFTQSLSRLMDVVASENDDSKVEKGLDFIRRQMAGWLKPGLVREIESLGDPEIRKVLRDGAMPEGSFAQEFDTLMNEVRSGWPGFSSAKDAEGNDLVPMARDRVTGEPTIVESWPFNPFPGRTPKDIPVTMFDGTKTGVYAELRRLNGASLQEWPQWLAGQRPQPDYGLDPVGPRAGGGVRMTRQEQDRWAVLFTQVVKDPNGENYAQAMKRLMESEQYFRESDGSVGSDGGKAKALRRLDEGFEKTTREALFGETRTAEGQPGKLERMVLESQAERKLQQVPTAQQPDMRKAVQDALDNLRGLPNSLTR
jgi:hypothetical protein